MSLLAKKVLFFGSDTISLNTLKIIRKHIPQLSIVLPPLAKPRTPLADLHKFVKEENVWNFYEFS
jgi:hypothetical protein